MKIEQYVTITGRIPHPTVPSYINIMDICIIPKHEKYTSPVKLFEYMAMGKTVVVPDYESLKEVVEDGENGFIFNADDYNSLYNILVKLIKNPILCESVREKAREGILKKYTWRQNALIIEKEYNKNFV